MSIQPQWNFRKKCWSQKAILESSDWNGPTKPLCILSSETTSMILVVSVQFYCVFSTKFSVEPERKDVFVILWEVNESMIKETLANFFVGFHYPKTSNCWWVVNSVDYFSSQVLWKRNVIKGNFSRLLTCGTENRSVILGLTSACNIISGPTTHT